MFFEILTAIMLGIAVGTLTGLIPGIHVNLVAVLLLSTAVFLQRFVNVFDLAVFIVAMAVTHSFLDTIPSIFLGAPESATALGVLPGHRYLLKGKGYRAVMLTVIGSLGALILSVALIPVLIFVMPIIYSFVKEWISLFLILTVVFMILRERKKSFAIAVFLLSGFLGLIALNSYIKNPLFPMLSGLFGLSTLIISLFRNEKIPEQRIMKRMKIAKKKLFKAIASGSFAGFLTSMFPGLGPAQGAVIAMQLVKKLGDYGFLILIGCITTANFILSLVTFYILDKARNGAIIGISKIIPSLNLMDLAAFTATALIAGGLATFLALHFAELFSKLIKKINYRKLVFFIVFFIIALVLLLSGFIGLLILMVATAIGIIPAIVRISRTHLMGCLLLPIILYFIL